MQKSILRALTYPPPPPPPPSKGSSKITVAVLVIILAVAAIFGTYYVTTLPANNNNPSASPSVSPSASHSPLASSTASPSPTNSPHPSTTPTTASSASPTPSSSGQTYLGYRAGAWANYTVKNYNPTGGVTAQYTLGYSVEQTIFKGVDCWLFQTELELLGDGSGVKTITTYWLDQSNLQGLHYKIIIYSNGVVISSTENDYSPGDFNNIPTAIDPKTVITKETIVVPAGTFNCDKATTTTTDLGNNYVTTVWGNSNIPIIGMVKQDLASNGVRITSTELIAYGG
jgi:hypothetical protein